MFYAYEKMNCSTVGPFTTREEAKAWMLRVVPPEDRDGTPENDAVEEHAGLGWSVGTIDEVNEWVDPVFETPAEAEARYAECYDEFYPSFKADTRP